MSCEPSVFWELELPGRPPGIDETAMVRVILLPCLDGRSSGQPRRVPSQWRQLPSRARLEKVRHFVPFPFQAPHAVMGLYPYREASN